MYVPLTQEELKEIGSRIRTMQRMNNLNDEDMAKILGISTNTYRNMLRGRSMMNISYLKAICNRCNARYSYILDGVEEMSNEVLMNQIFILFMELLERCGVQIMDMKLD